MSESRLKVFLSSLALIIAISLLLILLWQLRSLLVILMIAVVIASTLSPIVNLGEKMFLPRWLAVILAYLSIIAIITGMVLIIGPTVVAQIQLLVQKLPIYLEILTVATKNLLVRLGIDEPEALNLFNQIFNLQALASWVVRSSQRLLLSSIGITRGIVGGVLNVVLSLLLSGYMLAGSEKLIKGIVSLFPKPWDERLEEQVAPVSQRMGSYIQGRILVSFILGVFITIGLKFIGITEFALGLGVIAGFTNLIPFFGPVLGSIPALIVAVAQGGWTFLWVLLLFVIIQNVETYVLDPLLVGSSVNVAPLYQLLAVLGGVQVLGIMGALIVPPWVAGAGVILENLYLKPKLEAEKLAVCAENIVT
jgi:predicted PurR-regulated permease PerM